MGYMANGVWGLWAYMGNVHRPHMWGYTIAPCGTLGMGHMGNGGNGVQGVWGTWPMRPTGGMGYRVWATWAIAAQGV